MVEQQQYLVSVLSPADPHSEDTSSLSDNRSSTSSYPDLGPYSAVSTFTLPTQCEPDLLTPISVADSPPLHQMPKLMGQYPPPPGSPHGQEPNPPGSSKMYHQWNHHQFEMNSHPSETSSPMHTPAHVAQDFYMADRRTPGPPEPYMGSFGVSDATHPQSLSQSGSPYYLDMPHIPSQSTMLLRGNPPIPMEPHARELDRNISLTAPLLHELPRNPQIRRARRPSSNNVGLKAEHPTTDALRSPSDSPRRRPGIIGASNRVKKTGRRKSTVNSQPDPAEEHQNCHGEEVPPTLKDTCPVEERCIFESRWRHRNKRGQDMWDSIQNDFFKEFNKSHGKEMLQMKFKRARSKYIQWLPRDEEILREAWRKIEQERYKMILDVFLEKGGSRNMRLNPSDIEVKLVNDLKLEEHLYMDCFREIDVRRRRKLSTKKRTGSGGRRDEDGVPMGGDNMVGVDAHHQHTHDEDDVINQVHNPRSRWEGLSASSGEMMDMQMWDSRPPMKLEPPAPSHRMLTGVPRGCYQGNVTPGACV
ncbi:uncharacterized protein MAM_03371 [Metarhizium album ARSEF 1941]|uniref:Uncharacterized protein n=1 Tax=Metarhizium album (strain ARSEF 1941) TaxID=1081103 RepID=A0A0B2WZA6_METAS|nr:uncharacterized protein MAM_03371 [Metarhizium album ARSEF 1941]KHN98909.1 hypothetical protein MAM_03371 [Metarhizium album ARSEF 1941]